MTEEIEEELAPAEPLLKEDKSRYRALLVGVFKPAEVEKRVAEENLDELEFLAETWGVETVAKVACNVRKYEAGLLVTKGKLEELVEAAKASGADLVIFDDEISPAQQRNLEEVFEMTVMDRTELILEVFAQRARTREARLQIELARTRYQFPRLKRLWTHLSRQRMSGGFLKGDGETQLEIDKRLLQKRVDRLTKQIEEVKSSRSTQRSARKRSEVPIFAIIGYTNAGKSTLLNALTNAGVFVEDKLFATLDTTTRKFTLPNNQEILLIDTVGFIRKLPHQVIAAFRSTLEEALQADILVHVIDVSHPQAEDHVETTHEVLKELKAEDCPMITVFNKTDLVEDPSIMHKLRIKYPKTVRISAVKGEGFEDLYTAMVQELAKRRVVVDLRVPQSEYGVVSELTQQGNILHQDYDGNDVLLKVEIPRTLEGVCAPYLV